MKFKMGQKVRLEPVSKKWWYQEFIDDWHKIGMVTTLYRKGSRYKLANEFEGEDKVAKCNKYKIVIKGTKSQWGYWIVDEWDLQPVEKQLMLFEL